MIAVAAIPSQKPQRSRLLPLRRHCGRHGANADADLHRGIFREHDVAAARDEVDIDGAACAKCAHGDSEGI